MMPTQQISLFSLNPISKTNILLEDQFDHEIDKPENTSLELINPLFFLGLTVYIDLLDESLKEKAECVLKIIGAHIIIDPVQQEKIFDADVIITDKDEYRNQILLNQKANSIYVPNKIDAMLGFGNHRRQISTINKKRNSIIINPEQIPWAFVLKSLKDDQNTQLNNFACGINQSWFNNSMQLPAPLPSQPRSAAPIEILQQSSNIINPFVSNLPNEQEIAKSQPKTRKAKILNSQNIGFRMQVQKTLDNNTNNIVSTAPISYPNSHFTGGLIVVADSTMRSAPNFCYLNQMPEIRSKPLPDGIQFISPFVNDENITKLCQERTESLLANSNISNNANLKISKNAKVKEARKKNTSKDGGRSNAAACRYCNICKKTVTDEDKHRSSVEHKQNVSKQFQQVDELIECFSNFPYF